MSLQERETVAVALGEDNIIIIPLADAVAEYLRLEAKTNRDENDTRIFAALTLSLGTLSTTGQAQKLHDALGNSTS